MPLADLRVDELRLRVPGLDRSQGARLARAVQERLAAKVATGAVPMLTGPLRVSLPEPLPSALSIDELADRIVLQLTVQLGLED